MNLKTLLLGLVIASSIASANTYIYPKEKRPSVSLSEASAIAERIIAQQGLKGYYALSANLLGDEKQTGVGAWNLDYSNSKGEEILINVSFPEDMVGYQGPTKDQKFALLVYTRNGEISKKWLEQEAKLKEENKESDLFWKSLAKPDKEVPTKAAQPDADPPVAKPAAKPPVKDQPSSPTSKDG